MERPRPPVVGTPRVTVAWWPAVADMPAVHGWLLLLFAVALMARAVPAGSAPSLLVAAGLGTWALRRTGSRAGLALGAFLALWTLPAAFPLLAAWPLRQGIPVLVALAWLERPRWGRLAWGPALAAGAAATVAMLAWLVLGVQDGGAVRAGMAGYGGWTLAAVALAFAAINAPIEELAWRGMLLGGLERVGVPPAWAALLQALGFGLFEAWGEPSGWAGFFLGTAFGLILALLRWRAKGLATPIMAHFLADLAIVGAVLSR